MNESGKACGERGVINAQLLLHARRHVDHQHIGGLEQFGQHSEAFGLADIQRHAVLVAVHTEKPECRAIQEGRAPLARIVAGTVLFDLQHRCAEIGQQLRGIGPGDGGAQVQHPDACEHVEPGA